MDQTNTYNTFAELSAEVSPAVEYCDTVLGQLDPHPDFWTQPLPANLIDTVTGLQILDGHGPNGGKPKRALEFLPPHLPSKLGPVKCEEYFRKHYHLTYRDLWHRQPAGTPYPKTNALNQQRKRKARRPYNARCWTLKYQETQQPTRALIEVVETLTWDHIERNTTWILVDIGIMDPVNQDRILPHDYFLRDGFKHFPSKVVIAALEESVRLNKLAKAHGKRHWSQLPKEMLPVEWLHEKKGGTDIEEEGRLDLNDADEAHLAHTTRVSKSQVRDIGFTYDLKLSVTL